jgi:hypothetical protein
MLPFVARVSGSTISISEAKINSWRILPSSSLEFVEMTIVVVLDPYAHRRLHGRSGTVRQDLDCPVTRGLKERTTSATADG